MSVALVTGSCDKKVKGCTDPDSVNYDELAEKDDNSCRYEGYAVIWFSREASEGLAADGATSLTYYIDDQEVGASTSAAFLETEPECGDNGAINITRDMGKNKTKTYTLSVKDQEGFEYWRTDITLEGNTCLALELSWSSRKKK
jgi:hypothetical protein